MHENTSKRFSQPFSMWVLITTYIAAKWEKICNVRAGEGNVMVEVTATAGLLPGEGSPAQTADGNCHLLLDGHPPPDQLQNISGFGPNSHLKFVGFYFGCW